MGRREIGGGYERNGRRLNLVTGMGGRNSFEMDPLRYVYINLSMIIVQIATESLWRRAVKRDTDSLKVGKWFCQGIIY